MQKLTLDRRCKAAIYLRLSREDGDFSCSSEKLESNSISNQRLVIMEYLKTCPEITFVREYCDDGYTGANFDRPAFQKMMEAVKQGEIDCIVVKDLSRFGREYIGSGAYIQKLFPLLGVRFIAINDNYDNARPGAADNELILPFKNLMNDSYCRDISVKVRSNLEAKRRNGQFVGSKVIYGYMRSPENKNLLIIDPEAAAVVQDIFRWKMDGQSPAQIAERLNRNHIPSPIEYKKNKGSKQRTCFQTREVAQWSPVAIYRILRNEMYTGTLVQGKTTSPNHKVKKTVQKAPDEWSRTEHAHEAIIAPAQFELIQKLMLEDTRSPVGANGVHIFSGKVFCAGCGSSMVRKVSRCGGREYTYFVCGGNKADKHLCSSHMIRESAVYDAVLLVIQAQIAAAMDLSLALRQVEDLAWENRELERIKSKRAFQEEIAEKNRRLKAGAYDDFKNGFIDKADYKTFTEQFERRIREAAEAITQLDRERSSVMGGLAKQQGWLSKFMQYENIQELSRNSVVALVDRIEIREDKDIDVHLLHSDHFASIVAFLKEQGAGADVTVLPAKREAV